MKAKVTMFNAEGVQVGETFTRRARQLVSQQRAEWINENAIRFAPDADMDLNPIEDIDIEDTEHETLLYYLAKKRIRERKQFIYHSILMIPGYLACLFLGILASSEVVFLVSAMCWTTPYPLHIFLFLRNLDYKSKDRKRQLEDEVDRLRKVYK